MKKGDSNILKKENESTVDISGCFLEATETQTIQHGYSNDTIKYICRQLPSMLNSLRKAIKFPEAAKRKAKANLVRHFANGSYPSESHVNLEWDNLVILDACRYDIFEAYNPFDEPVQKVQSNASHTTDFLDRNLTGNQSDTVYITASPQVTKYESRFHDVIHVWQDKWDSELRTVLPQSVTEASINTIGKYNDKKIVIHYMQPHYPFIGPTGRELDIHATFTGGLRERKHLSIWEMLSSGKVAELDVKKAYKENLEIVLEEVMNLNRHLDGKTIITSDHGNLFGERVSPLPIKLYGHPSNIPAENLISVPLVELPYDERRIIKGGDSIEGKYDHDEAESRLKDLGYI